MLCQVVGPIIVLCLTSSASETRSCPNPIPKDFASKLIRSGRKLTPLRIEKWAGEHCLIALWGMDAPAPSLPFIPLSLLFFPFKRRVLPPDLFEIIHCRW